MKSKAKTIQSTKKAKATPTKKATAQPKPVKAPPLKLKAGPAPKEPSDVLLQALDIDSIMPSPYQHRSEKMANDTELPGLADSIKANGILQPLTVRKAKGDAPSGIRYELVFGHRRLAAAKLAGLKHVPCILSTMDNPKAHFANIIENLQRKDLSPIDEADGVNALTETAEMTAPQIAKMLGVSERWVFRRRKLAAIIPEWRKIIRDEKAGQLFCERLATCPHPLQKVLLKSPLTKDPDAEKIGGTLYEAGARDIKEMPWSKVHKDWCFACPSIVDTVKDADADLGQTYRLNGCQFCGDPTCRATKEKAWIKERLEAFARSPHKGTNTPPKLVKRGYDAGWDTKPEPSPKYSEPFMVTEGQEAGKVIWAPKPPKEGSTQRNAEAKPKPEIPGKKEELIRINAIHALVEEGAQDTTSMRRALELVLLYGADFISDGKITSSRHSQFLKALNMPDDELAKAVSKYVREDHFNVWALQDQTYLTTEKDTYDFKGEAEQLALTFGITEKDIEAKAKKEPGNG